jgi:dihydroorotase
VADITVIDPAREWTVDVKSFRSKSVNTPFNGWTLQGRAVATIVAGRVKYRLGRV